MSSQHASYATEAGVLVKKKSFHRLISIPDYAGCLVLGRFEARDLERSIGGPSRCRGDRGCREWNLNSGVQRSVGPSPKVVRQRAILQSQSILAFQRATEGRRAIAHYLSERWLPLSSPPSYPERGVRTAEIYSTVVLGGNIPR